MSIRASWCALFILAVAGAACHAKPPAMAATRPEAPPATAPARPPAPPAPPPAAARPAPVRPLTEAEIFARKSLSEMNAEQPLSDAFFDYNQNVLRDDARRALQQDAQWLSKWPQTKIRVDGHCDERGSAEYNLALGERRAEAVREGTSSAWESARIGLKSAVLGKMRLSAGAVTNRAGRRTGAVISKSPRSDRRSVHGVRRSTRPPRGLIVAGAPARLWEAGSALLS